MMKSILLMFACCGIPNAGAESAVRKTVDFTVTADVGFGNEVCVMGSHPLLGGGNPLRAPKLTWSSGNVWRGKIALEAGTSFSYQFISRDFKTSAWVNTSNATPIGSAASVTSPTHVAAPWGAKCILYRSGFPQVKLLYRDLTHGGAWTEAAMKIVGPGRTPAEQTFRVDGLAPSGSEIEFVFHNGSGTYDNAPGPPSMTPQGAAPGIPAPYAGWAPPYNYRTMLDVFMVQDGSVFNEIPATSPSAPRFETRQISSTVAGIPGRPITILLPRGYDQNPRKRYPVVYFHDGQNVNFPGGSFGTWDADRIATYETSQGRLREAILVAVPNDGANRLREYLPNGDTIIDSGTTYQGNAAAYAQFLLDNVLPTLNFNYRTKSEARETFTVGSSMGGLVADFIGFTHPDRFGGIGIFSPAYWTAPNWVAQRDAAAKLPLRRYLYMGTAEPDSGESSNTHWRNALQAYDAWMGDGHVVNDDLLFDGGGGESHNEGAWSRHMPAFFAFALNPWREANPLAHELFPPQVTLQLLDLPAAQAVIRYTGLYGTAQAIQDGNNLQGWTSHPLPSETQYWDTRDAAMPLTQPSPSKWFWRLRQDPYSGGL